jgi:polysaccharide pyruvyl transferase WcaK-like protein
MAIKTTQHERLASQLEKSNNRLARLTIEHARLEDTTFQRRQSMMEENRQLREHKHSTEAVNLQLLEQQQADEQEVQRAQSMLAASDKQVEELSAQRRAAEEETHRLYPT